MGRQSWGCGATMVVGLAMTLGCGAGSEEPSATPESGGHRELDAASRAAASPDARALESSGTTDAAGPPSPSAVPDGGGAPHDASASRCSPDRSRAPLAYHPDWSPSADADDPFLDERPADYACDADRGYGAEAFAPGELEDSSFFVSTLWCNYLTVEQPSRVEICEGDTVAVRIWRSGLTAPAGATVHVAAALDGEVLFESTTLIPSGSGQLSEEFVATRDHPVGTMLQFHVHNHGSNEYNLLDITSGPDAP